MPGTLMKNHLKLIKICSFMILRGKKLWILITPDQRNYNSVIETKRTNSSLEFKNNKIGEAADTLVLPTIMNNIQSNQAELARKDSDYNFNVKVKRKRFKISDQLKPAYEKKYVQLELPPDLNKKLDEDNKRQRNYNMNSRSQQMIGSLKIQFDKQNQIYDGINKRYADQVYHYPTIAQDILPERLVPGRINSQSIEQDNFNFLVKKHQTISNVLQSVQQSPNQSIVRNEVNQNIIGKTYLRQMEHETKRLQNAEKMADATEREHASFPDIQPININPEEQQQILRLFNSRNRQRYLERVKHLKDRKYNDFWLEYNIGQGRPKNHENAQAKRQKLRIAQKQSLQSPSNQNFQLLGFKIDKFKNGSTSKKYYIINLYYLVLQPIKYDQVVNTQDKDREIQQLRKTLIEQKKQEKNLDSIKIQIAEIQEKYTQEYKLQQKVQSQRAEELLKQYDEITRQKLYRDQAKDLMSRWQFKQTCLILIVVRCDKDGEVGDDYRMAERLRDEIRKIKQDRTLMFKEMSQLKIEIQEGDSSYKFTKQKLDKNEAQLQKVRAKVLKLEDRILDRENLKVQSQAVLDKLVDQVKKYKKKVRFLRSQNNDFDGRSHDNNIDIEAIRKECLLVTQQHLELNQKVDYFQKVNREQIQFLDNAGLEIQKCKDNLAEQERQIDKNMALISSLKEKQQLMFEENLLLNQEMETIIWRDEQLKSYLDKKSEVQSIKRQNREDLQRSLRTIEENRSKFKTPRNHL
ncbi:UNKNOWN [Stylonychia lemnae]|uniref:Uncharacterized protein n=1 Tax=Stylonychia lemnae TaxID=5949 RepID=A0A078AMF8_STYLE|nr:UNKNOWN [Stylonychia lemnae]|eukprot:CDW82038.1 UNKNOWN [Stylonychia lemnae]